MSVFKLPELDHRVGWGPAPPITLNWGQMVGQGPTLQVEQGWLFISGLKNRYSSTGSLKEHSFCGQTFSVPLRLVVLMVRMGQPQLGQGSDTGSFHTA